MICGPVGSGKTTYSKKLALEHAAVVFSMDEWMQTFLGAIFPRRQKWPRWTWRGLRSGLIVVRGRCGQ
ncbi:AAA family ATPase [Granulicella aggregans]|uniref:AAA family ATPase n=1 Tax=Granulicella aggregans TaxID=474949 RepID=UPI001C853DED